MEERYHATTQNRFYPDMSNVNRNITVEAKLISPPTFDVLLVNAQFIERDKFIRLNPHTLRGRGVEPSLFFAVWQQIVLHYKQ